MTQLLPLLTLVYLMAGLFVAGCYAQLVDENALPRSPFILVVFLLWPMVLATGLARKVVMTLLLEVL